MILHYPYHGDLEANGPKDSAQCWAQFPVLLWFAVSRWSDGSSRLATLLAAVVFVFVHYWIPVLVLLYAKLGFVAMAYYFPPRDDQLLQAQVMYGLSYVFSWKRRLLLSRHTGDRVRRPLPCSDVPFSAALQLLAPSVLYDE